MAAGPLNPPTLGARRVGSFTGAGIGRSVEKKLYGGRGLGLVSCSQVAAEVFKIGGFYDRKMKDFVSGTMPGVYGSPIGSPGGVRRASGELLGAPRSPKVDQRRPILGQFEPQGHQKWCKSKLRVV